jgi:transcriptional regulator with GAF, ATPase, and Fis domain
MQARCPSVRSVLAAAMAPRCIQMDSWNFCRPLLTKPPVPSSNRVCLKETQQRAHQLSSLNEITRQLTSTLELNPLLQNILENAVGILNCEAGSLFLLDEQTDELVFKVTVGPVATNLIGQRLPSNTGIVGRAVQSRWTCDRE